MNESADIIIVGAGLAGLVAAAEAADAGRRVFLVDQEPEASLGGQAFWSFGGLFLVNTPEQRLLGIRDFRELALQDWLGAAGYDRPDDLWPRRWAEAYIDFAAGEKRSWLHHQGIRFLRIPAWAERGGYWASGHGNTVPRFHIIMGTGPGLLEPFIRRVKAAEAKGLIRIFYRHRVTQLTLEKGAVTGVSGQVLEPSQAERGAPSSRKAIGDFSFKAQAVIITSGGLGGNHDLVRKNWPPRLGPPPKTMLSGVPDYVDGSMLAVAQAAGGNFTHSDRMWHYPEGLHNYAPIWTNHAIRILSGPSPLWLDAHGRRLPAPLFPGYDALGALSHINRTGYSHSWFILNRKIIEKEFALSGSEQNPDLTSKNVLGLLNRALPWAGAPEPVAKFMDKGSDFVIQDNLPDLVKGMNTLVGENLVDFTALEREIVARDRDVASDLGKDAQIMAIRSARRYFGDRLLRITSPDRLLNAKHGPLIAVRLTLMTRKTLGGLQTDLSSRVLKADGEPLPGLYAAGEVAGFGGGGIHGYRSLEGTFLGGCLFSGRIAGRAAAAAAA